MKNIFNTIPPLVKIFHHDFYNLYLYFIEYNLLFSTYISRGVFMEKLKIIDFDFGCGGFSKGLEDTGLFEVIYNGSINKKNKMCYNNIHINNFDELDIIPNEADLVIYTPHLGNKLYGIGRQNFQFSELNNFTALTTIKNFQNVIFITNRESIPLLQQSNKVSYLFDGRPTLDIISSRLLDLNYNVFNFVLDGAGFGLPQHKYYNIYWASKNIDKSIEIKEGFGVYKRKYRTVGNVLKDIDDNSDISWHNPVYKKKIFAPKFFQAKKLLQRKIYHNLLVIFVSMRIIFHNHYFMIFIISLQKVLL